MRQVYTRASNDVEMIEMMEVGDNIASALGLGSDFSVNSTNLSYHLRLNRPNDELSQAARCRFASTRPASEESGLASQRPSTTTIQSKKISLLSENNDELLADLGGAIRSGDRGKVSMILLNNPPDILKQCKIYFKTRFRTIPSKITWLLNKPLDVMYITPFQLAIICQQSDVVELMLQTSLDYNRSSKESRAFLEELLKAKTKVDFSKGDPNEYYKDDRTLDQINAIHIASRFHAQSLYVIVKFLLNQDFLFLPEFQVIFEERDYHMGKTPLHMAVKSPSQHSTKLLLDCGADVEAKDKRGYSALHMAAKEGNEGQCLLLLEYGANTNLHGNGPKYYKTPLHRARTQKVVHLLIKYGASPYAKMHEDDKDGGSQDDSTEAASSTVLDCLLKRHPQAVEEILNAGITTNGQDLDSNDLQIIFDFELFFQEGMPSQLARDFDMTIAQIDEMAAHNKIVNANERDLLKHPLAEAFLHMKYQMVQRFSYLNLVLYALFLLTLTTLCCIHTYAMKCQDDANLTSYLQCDSTAKWKTDSIRDVLVHYMASENDYGTAYSYVAFYIMTIMGLLFLITRETLQGVSYWKLYIKSSENILEAFISLFTLAYLILVFFKVNVAVHLGAWAVFCGWIEMTLLLGRIPSIGIFIYMSVNVMKTMANFLLVYSPVLMGFAFTFHILLPSKEPFTSPFFAPIKVLAMMTGELDLDNYFTWNQSKADSGMFSTQVIFVAFLVFVSIVIANLLIGLTVNKTEELFKEAGGIRLEKTVNQVAGFESIFIKGQSKSIFRRCLPKQAIRAIYRSSRFFYKLRNAFPKDSVIDGKGPSPWKICVLPHSMAQMKKNSKGRKFLDIKASLDTSSSSFDKSFWVYLYDDLQGYFHDKLPFSIPAWVIGKTLTLLRDQKSARDLRIAHEIEQEIGSGEGGTLLKLLRESASISTRPESNVEPDQVLEDIKEAKAANLQMGHKRKNTVHLMRGIQEECSKDTDDFKAQLIELKSDIDELKQLLLNFRK